MKFTVLAASGQPAPGERTGEIYNYQTFGEAAVNAGGQVSFSGLGTSAAPGEGRAVWSGFPGAVDLVLRSGDPSPLPGVDFDGNQCA